MKISLTQFSILIAILVCCKQNSSNPTENQQPGDTTEITTRAFTDTSGTSELGSSVGEISNVDEATAENTEFNMNHWYLPSSLFTVISTRPVPLFEDTARGAKVIRYLSFGDTVRVSRPLALSKMTDPFSNREFFGAWLEVSYGTLWGVIFSSYLASRDPGQELQPDAAILLKGSSCNENFAYRADYTFYGVYSTSIGNFLKELKPLFYTTYDSTRVGDLHTIETDSAARPLFILAINRKLREGVLDTVDLGRELAGGKTFKTGKYMLSGTVELEYDYYTHCKFDFKDTKGNIVEQIDTWRLIWTGDLDQDGKLDLVYLEGEDKAGAIMLALSSFADQGKPFKRVHGYDVGYCC